MDIIWDRKSFEVGGHCPMWRRWKKRMTTHSTVETLFVLQKRLRECCI